jgi:hypothetical protein
MDAICADGLCIIGDSPGCDCYIGHRPDTGRSILSCAAQRGGCSDRIRIRKSLALRPEGALNSLRQPDDYRDNAPQVFYLFPILPSPAGCGR